jgi:Short C-terminal domain
MGLFKSMKDIAGVTKQAKQLQEEQQQKAGYKPGMGGMMSQMGDMLGQANQQLGQMAGQAADQDRILAEGMAGEAVIVGMGTPARGAQQYNLDLDLEVHVGGRAPYRVANQYIVPASAKLGQGVRLPVKVDPNDPAKIAIDWQSAESGPVRGEVRPAGGSGFSPAPTAAGGSASGGDSVAELERLAKLRDSGALTEAEFEQQKARILAG